MPPPPDQVQPTPTTAASQLPEEQTSDSKHSLDKPTAKELSDLQDSTAFKAALKDIDKENDIVIVVIGATGVGKTSFIAAIAGTGIGGEWVTSDIGHDLNAGTKDIVCYKIPIPNTNSNLVLVDTPGFDDPSRSNAEILTIVANWLKESYQQKQKLNGLVYLQRITDVRFDSGASTTLNLFRHLVGGDNMDKVCLTTSRWNDVPPGHEPEYEKREEDLKKGHWQLFLTRKALTSRFDSTSNELARKTATATIRSLIGVSDRQVVTQIQKEMVDLKKKIHKTEAGKYVFSMEDKIKAQIFHLEKLMVIPP